MFQAHRLLNRFHVLLYVYCVSVVLVLIFACKAFGISISVSGPDVFYPDGSDWVRDTSYSDYGSMWEFVVSTLPSDGTTPCMFVLYCGGEPAGANGGGSFGGLPAEWEDYIQFQVGASPSSSILDLVFSAVGEKESPQVVVGGSFRVAVILEPKPGMTWEDVPGGGYLQMTLKGARSQGPSGVSMAQPFYAIRGRTIAYVDVVNGSHSGPGTSGEPFKDLLSGIGAVRDGTVVVAPGVYNAPTFGGLSIRYTYRMLEKRLLILGQSGVSVTEPLTGGRNAIVEDCAISHDGGGSFYAQGRDITYRRCTIIGGIIFLSYGGTTATFENCTLESGEHPEWVFRMDNAVSLEFNTCLLTGNSATSGPLFWVREDSSLVVTNSTITDNSSIGELVYCESGHVEITNSILYGNSQTGLTGQSSQYDIGYSCVEGYVGGTGNIDQDPMFLNPDSGDYRISLGSPCRDSGSPLHATTHDITGAPRDDSPDMGAYEASKSGELTGDAVIDVLDVRLCLQIANGVLPGTPAQRDAADVDGDGDVDMDDVKILSEYVIGVRTTLP